jgi:hypothetical protein
MSVSVVAPPRNQTKALENMMFSRAFCRRGFGQQYRSWKRQEESRSVNSAELRDGVIKLADRPRMVPTMDWRRV